MTGALEWGEMAIRYARLPADGTTEKAEAGQAYHWPAGHTAWTDEPVAFPEIGPVAEMRQFSEHATAQFG